MTKRWQHYTIQSHISSSLLVIFASLLATGCERPIEPAAPSSPGGTPPAVSTPSANTDWTDVKMKADLAIANNDWPRAQSLYMDVVRLTENNKPAQINALLALGDVLIKTKKYADAQTQFKKALTEAQALSPTSIQCAHALLGLSNAYKFEKKYEQSESSARDALKIAQKNARSADDPILDDYVGGVIGVACLNGVCKDESALMQQLYLLRLKNLGADDYRTAAARTMLAELKEHHKQYADAEKLYSENLRILQRTKGSPSGIDGVKLCIARVAIAQGKYRQAGTLVSEVMANKPDPSLSMNAMKVQSQLLSKQGKKKEAAELFARRLNMMKGILGENDPSLANVYFEYADLLRDAGKPDAAAAAEKQGSKIANAPRSTAAPTNFH